MFYKSCSPLNVCDLDCSHRVQHDLHHECRVLRKWLERLFVSVANGTKVAGEVPLRVLAQVIEFMLVCFNEPNNNVAVVDSASAKANCVVVQALDVELVCQAHHAHGMLAGKIKDIRVKVAQHNLKGWHCGILHATFVAAKVVGFAFTKVARKHCPKVVGTGAEDVSMRSRSFVSHCELDVAKRIVIKQRGQIS